MLLSINQLIHISLDGGENYNYKARVADVNKEQFSIEMPIDERTGFIKVIYPGEVIKVEYISHDLGQFIFETKVLKIKEDQVSIIILEYPKTYDRIQRRDYLRVPASLDTFFKILEHNDNKIHNVKTIDISGGGIQFLLPNIKLNPDEKIKGWIVLPVKNGPADHVNFLGKVLRTTQTKENISLDLVSIEFIDLPENMREKVIRYCYDKQVEIRKKAKK